MKRQLKSDSLQIRLIVVDETRTIVLTVQAQPVTRDVSPGPRSTSAQSVST